MNDTEATQSKIKILLTIPYRCQVLWQYLDILDESLQSIRGIREYSAEKLQP